MCGTSDLDGPATPPAGAVVVQPEQDLLDVTNAAPAGTTFWLAPGVHSLSSGQYANVRPKDDMVFIGGPGAIIDGGHKAQYAFVGDGKNVTISFLTIRNFGWPGSTGQEGVVNHDAAQGWNMHHLTVSDNSGAGVFLGNDNVIADSCIASNGQYGISAYRVDGVRNVKVLRNEITDNNTDDWETRIPGCGCSGGAKFWEVENAEIVGNNVHRNKGAGLWADTNNTGFTFENNHFAANDDEAIFYEISYNAAIRNNTFVRNGITKGRSTDGFPTPAIYLSESGGDTRAPGPHRGVIDITGNVFEDNWGGIVAWENPDRFAGSPANSSTGYSTLVNDDVTLSHCSEESLMATTDYSDDCRWKTQNVHVHDNTFKFNPEAVGDGCANNELCGINGLFSNWGSYPSWSPWKGDVVNDAITFNQNNRWENNTYSGPWRFMIHQLGDEVTWSQWRSAPYNQDANSTLN
ncbi:MAG: hypothetical protein CSA84_05145 [Actinomycetales bacterium]|nr:MAG: hypothetical protein CSA84_05145 [Actinomycetales bacterium]